MLMSRIALGVVASLGISSASFAAYPFVEDFTSNRNPNWSVYETNGTAFNPGPGNTGPAPFAAADANNGHFFVPIPSYDGHRNVPNDYGNGLLAVALNNEANNDGFWQSAAGTAAIYNGGLLGNLNNPKLSISINYKVNISGTYQPVDNTGAPVGAPITVNPGDPLTPGMFYAGSYGHPASGDPGQYTFNPEEVRVSLYLRRYDPDATGDSASNESTRWFNEAQSNRMLFAFGPNAGLKNGLTTQMNTSLDPSSGLWSNYWGYGNSAGGPWTGPSGTGPSNFQYTLSDVQQLRFQIDSSFFGANGTALAPGLVGSLEILSIGTFLPEPTSLGFLGIVGVGLLRRRSR